MEWARELVPIMSSRTSAELDADVHVGDFAGGGDLDGGAHPIPLTVDVHVQQLAGRCDVDDIVGEPEREPDLRPVPHTSQA